MIGTTLIVGVGSLLALLLLPLTGALVPRLPRVRDRGRRDRAADGPRPHRTRHLRARVASRAGTAVSAPSIAGGRIARFIAAVERQMLDLVRGNPRRLAVLLDATIALVRLHGARSLADPAASGTSISVVGALAVETFSRVASFASAFIPANLGALEASSLAAVDGGGRGGRRRRAGARAPAARSVLGGRRARDLSARRPSPRGDRRTGARAGGRTGPALRDARFARARCRRTSGSPACRSANGSFARRFAPATRASSSGPAPTSTSRIARSTAPLAAVRRARRAGRGRRRVAARRSRRCRPDRRSRPSARARWSRRRCWPTPLSHAAAPGAPRDVAAGDGWRVSGVRARRCGRCRRSRPALADLLARRLDDAAAADRRGRLAGPRAAGRPARGPDATCRPPKRRSADRATRTPTPRSRGSTAGSRCRSASR